mmetsp:Transcript_5130/g.8646  ORF Transcript_5130/g.8646 Transcript_5130/m.8646 type:complete len:350 (+) Transcript_5130:34-1083(+)
MGTETETKRTTMLPDTFLVAFFELLILPVISLIIYLTMKYIVWPNEAYNEIFNHGFFVFHGFQCGDKYDNSGQYILTGALIAGCCLYIPSLVLLCLDSYMENKGILQQYKILYPAPRPHQDTISWTLYRESIYLAKINGIYGIILLPTVIIPMMEWRGNCDALLFRDSFSSSFSYAIAVIVARLLVTNFASDIIFYFAHRGCHEIKFLYKHVHKIHHQFINTYGISATACHPFEHVFVNLLTVIGAPIVSGLPLLPFWGWAAIACLQTTAAHCGYGNPFRKIQVGNATPHDFHHHFQNCEFGNGANGFSDRIFRTRVQDVYPQRYQQMQRDYGVLSDHAESKETSKKVL